MTTNRTPMLAHAADIVDHLHQQIKPLLPIPTPTSRKNSNEAIEETKLALTPEQPLPAFDEKIEEKYNTQKFILKNLDNETVETWVYRPKPFMDVPILEDQALKCAEAIIKGAELIFGNNKRADETTRQLRQLEEIFKNKIDKIFAINMVNINNYASLSEKINHYIHDLLNDVAWIYRTSEPGFTNPDASQLNHFFKKFYRELWKSIESANISYFKSNILAINTETKTVSYYERGTRPEYIDAKTEEKDKVYISAHKRDGVGVPNFIACSTGYLDKNNRPVLTDTCFRHGSLPPISLYKKEKPKDVRHPECVVITTRNIEILTQEMRSRVGERNQPLNWINVSLLTATDEQFDSEKQIRQYRETILAAERVRYRTGAEATVNPITFDFGVNIFAQAISPILSYPNDQKFENHRAYLQSFSLLMECLRAHKPLTANASAFTSMEALAAKFDTEINQAIKPVAQEYDVVCKSFETSPTPENRAAMLACEAKLNAVKEGLHKRADELINEYHTIYQSNKSVIDATLSQLKSAPEQKPLYFLLQDFSKITDYYLNKDNAWNKPENNFQIQSHIVDFASCAAQLGSYTTASWNCKSNNDRSTLMAIYVDLLRIRRLGERYQHVNAISHCMGAAWALSAILDTLGGGPKFGAREGLKLIQLDYGHPARALAKMQELTSDWAVHQIEKESMHIPDGYILFIPDELKSVEQAKSITDLRTTYNVARQNIDDQLQASSLSNDIKALLKEFFHTTIKKMIDSLEKSSDSLQKQKYFTVQIIQEFIDKIYSKLDSNNQEPVFQFMKQIAEAIQPQRRRNSSSLSSLTENASLDAKETPQTIVAPQTLEEWKEATKRGTKAVQFSADTGSITKFFSSGLKKIRDTVVTESPESKKIIKAISAYEAAVNTQGLPGLITQYDALLALQTALTQWLEKPRKTENRSDNRPAVTQAKLADSQQKLRALEDEFNSLYLNFISGQISVMQEKIQTAHQSNPVVKTKIYDSDSGSDSDSDSNKTGYLVKSAVKDKMDDSVSSVPGSVPKSTRLK